MHTRLCACSGKDGCQICTIWNRYTSLQLVAGTDVEGYSEKDNPHRWTLRTRLTRSEIYRVMMRMLTLLMMGFSRHRRLAHRSLPVYPVQMGTTTSTHQHALGLTKVGTSLTLQRYSQAAAVPTLPGGPCSTWERPHLCMASTCSLHKSLSNTLLFPALSNFWFTLRCKHCRFSICVSRLYHSIKAHHRACIFPVYDF